ncbi:MAG: hypothetical protein COA94_07770 [Rickettsiales bacterium]|nr:MAG: hypothetical protein COA94_07770 [Rickettsiales bacterium]
MTYNIQDNLDGSMTLSVYIAYIEPRHCPTGGHTGKIRVFLKATDEASCDYDLENGGCTKIEWFEPDTDVWNITGLSFSDGNVVATGSGFETNPEFSLFVIDGQAMPVQTATATKLTARITNLKTNSHTEIFIFPQGGVPK